MTKKSPLITLEAASARAEEQGIVLPTRWWRRQIEDGRVDCVKGVVTYVRQAVVDRTIYLAKLGATKPVYVGCSLIDAGKIAEGLGPDLFEHAEQNDVG